MIDLSLLLPGGALPPRDEHGVPAKGSRALHVRPEGVADEHPSPSAVPAAGPGPLKGLYEHARARLLRAALPEPNAGIGRTKSDECTYVPTLRLKSGCAEDKGLD